MRKTQQDQAVAISALWYPAGKSQPPYFLVPPVSQTTTVMQIRGSPPRGEMEWTLLLSRILKLGRKLLYHTVRLARLGLKRSLTNCSGEDYFGEDNCECLCATCETLCVNGWTPVENGEESIIPKKSIEDESGNHAYSFRRRRNRESSYSSRDASMTPDINIRPRVIKRTPRSLSRFQNQNSPLGRSPSVEASLSPLKRKRESEISPSPSASSKRARRNLSAKPEPSPLRFSGNAISTLSPPSTLGSRGPSFSPSGTDGQNTTDATSADEDTIIVEPPTTANPLFPKVKKPRNTKLLSIENAQAEGSSTSRHAALDDDESALSELNSDIFSDTDLTVKIEVAPASDELSKTPKRGRGRKKRLAVPKTDLDHAPSIREPGDYVLTNRLLSEPQMAWVVCKICEESFVQQNSYFTRSSCPRCERHSKLYGYRWPKTDKEGRHDTEERVLDHRTIHRFIPPSEERLIRKRNRSLTESRATTRDATEPVIVEDDAVGERTKKRVRKRSRLTM
jgi:histone-lysine N-methyltransferase SUV420H